MIFLFYLEILLLILATLGYSREDQKEREEKPITKLKWHHLLSFLLGLFFVYGIIVGGSYFCAETENPTWKNDTLLLSKDFVISLITLFLFTNFLFLVSYWKQNKNWEKQNKQDLEQATEQHKKQMLELKSELTETKTELLLTQNKLQELKEKT